MKTVKLRYPIEHNGEEIKALTCRRVKVKDLAWIAEQIDGMEPSSSADMTMTQRVLARLCDVDDAVIGELDTVDFMAVRDASGFTEALQSLTGGPASPSSPTS